MHAFVLLLILSAPPIQELWVDGVVGPARVQLPSLAPIVEASHPALLTVKTAPATLPDGHPPVLGQDLRGDASGFLIHPSGLALTNQHVVGCDLTVPVHVGDDPRTYQARVVARDEQTDVALLQLPPRDAPWPYLPLGDAEAMRVGDFVVVIGNPFGLANSVSMGILSGRDRPPERTTEYDYLQIDAAINPGNSGGPVMDLAGNVIGVATAIHRQATRIGYAIPIDAVKAMLPGLKDQGRLVRGWLGVAIREVDQGGVEVMGLDDRGPAAQAGVQIGDVIAAFGGRPVSSALSLRRFAGLGGPGRTVELQVKRDGALRAVPVTLAPRPEPGGHGEGCGQGSWLSDLLRDLYAP